MLYFYVYFFRPDFFWGDSRLIIFTIITYFHFPLSSLLILTKTEGSLWRKELLQKHKALLYSLVFILLIIFFVFLNRRALSFYTRGKITWFFILLQFISILQAFHFIKQTTGTSQLIYPTQSQFIRKSSHLFLYLSAANNCISLFNRMGPYSALAITIQTTLIEVSFYFFLIRIITAYTLTKSFKKFVFELRFFIYLSSSNLEFLTALAGCVHSIEYGYAHSVLNKNLETKKTNLNYTLITTSIIIFYVFFNLARISYFNIPQPLFIFIATVIYTLNIGHVFVDWIIFSKTLDISKNIIHPFLFTKNNSQLVPTDLASAGIHSKS